MCKKINIIVLLLVFFLSGCQIQDPQKKEQNNFSSIGLDEPSRLNNMDIYNSLKELKHAFLTASTSNVCCIYPREKVYYLIEDNKMGLSLDSIYVRESYFNCVYSNDVLLITDRIENGSAALQALISNNPGTFTKKQEGDLVYYYIQENECRYYFWIQNDSLLQLNIPTSLDLSFSDILDNLAYMDIN